MPTSGHMSGCLGSTFSPAAFAPDLVAWYKARNGVYSDAGVTLATNGQTVRQWNDLSGHGYHLSMATAGQRPTFRQTGLNNRPALELVAASNTRLTSAANAVALGGEAVSAWLVAQLRNASDNNARLFSFQGQGQANDFDNAASFFWFRQGVTTNVGGFRNTQSIGLTSIPADQNFFYGVQFDSVRGTVYQSGASDASAGTFASLGTLTVGGNLADECWDGFISEVIVVKRPLSLRDRNFLTSYLASDWELT